MFLVFKISFWLVLMQSGHIGYQVWVTHKENYPRLFIKVTSWSATTNQMSQAHAGLKDVEDAPGVTRWMLSIKIIFILLPGPKIFQQIFAFQQDTQGCPLYLSVVLMLWPIGAKYSAAFWHAV